MLISVKFIKIVLPVKTRWNSVIMAMATVDRIAPALKKLRDDPLFAGLIPTDKQFEAFKEMLQPLQLIKQKSELLEREKAPTIHLVLPTLIKLCTISRSSKFKTSGNTTRAVIEAFEFALTQRIKDHGRQMPSVCFGNYLHPSFKGSLLNALGQDYYDQTVAEIKNLFPEVNPDSQNVTQEEV